MVVFYKKSLFLNIIFIIIISFIFSSCKNQRKETITPRIQYDVTIKTPNSHYDWWIQNIPGPQREKLIHLIIEGAKSGKFRTYDYFFHPLSKNDIQNIFADTIVRKIQRNVPPYDLYDSTIIKRIYPKQILKIRFLEKWEINPNDLSFHKIVMGIAPIARVADSKGIPRWQPLFWIIPNKKFLNSLNIE